VLLVILGVGASYDSAFSRLAPHRWLSSASVSGAAGLESMEKPRPEKSSTGSEGAIQVLTHSQENPKQ
jgi:hypothetical protein